MKFSSLITTIAVAATFAANSVMADGHLSLNGKRIGVAVVGTQHFWDREAFNGATSTVEKLGGEVVPVYIILIPIELMGLFVKPFALTMRLAANMTGGHIAILALLSLMAIIGEMFASASVGIGVGFIAVPMAAAIYGLEIIVILVQAYVFTLLTAVFVGMAINVHH